jgi:hypothetical protein
MYGLHETLRKTVGLSRPLLYEVILFKYSEASGTSLFRVSGEPSLDDCSAQVFPYDIFAYCSICGVDCKFARNK